MKVAVLGANSALGRRIVLHAEDCKMAVTSIVSTPADLVGNGPIIIKEPGELTVQELARFHVLIDALSFARIKAFAPGQTPLELLHDKLMHTSCHYLGIGDCSLLYVDNSRRQLLADSPLVHSIGGQSDPIRCKALWETLQRWGDFNWTLLCPPLLLDEHSYGKGRFELCWDVLPMGIDGSSRITLSDFIAALIELLKVRGAQRCCVSCRGLY